jgi:protein-disulfide isomerase
VSVGGVALAVVLVILAGALDLFGGGTKTLRSAPTVYSADLTDGATMGAKDAPVVMQVYSDFQCPACKAFITTELPNLVTSYVIPGVLRVESMDIDIIDRNKAGESLELAAGAACAAQQNRYWQYHDLVFWNQGGENKGDHDKAFIDAVATKAGLDMTAFQACYPSQDLRTEILQRTQDALTTGGITATPTVVVNGTPLSGVPDYATLTQLIEQELAKASLAPASTEAPTPAPAAS